MNGTRKSVSLVEPELEKEMKNGVIAAEQVKKQ
jgi:hypothetical protein